MGHGFWKCKTPFPAMGLRQKRGRLARNVIRRSISSKSVKMVSEVEWSDQLGTLGGAQGGLCQGGRGGGDAGRRVGGGHSWLFSCYRDH